MFSNPAMSKFSIHNTLASKLRGRRSAPILEVNTLKANNVFTNSNLNSRTTIRQSMANSLTMSKLDNNQNSTNTIDNLEETETLINDENNKGINTFSSVPDFTTLKEEEYIALKSVRRDTISASALNNNSDNRRSLIFKFTDKVSSAFLKVKNFDTGICSDLNINMNSMVKILEEESLIGIARYIKEHNCKNIIVMSGAGISTNAEIPDFRSADRGVYANLEKYNIPYPEAIFELEYFKRNPTPFTIFAKEIYPQNIRPTIAHCFIKLLDNHNILLRHYTQNIDGLDYQTRLDSDRIIESHGSFHQAYCVGTSETEACGSVYPQTWYKEKLFKGENPIQCENCKGYVKPGVIFFGENLPSKFFKSLNDDIPNCDLLLILGTSLKVYPFASIIKSVSKKIPRCLINNTLPDIFESELLCDESNSEYIFSDNQYKRDVIYMGDCDKVCL